MHNLISYNQLAYTKTDVKKIEEDIDNLIFSYFSCLSECDDDSQTCKRVCRTILKS